jgi:hypothetical protein
MSLKAKRKGKKVRRPFSQGYFFSTPFLFQRPAIGKTQDRFYTGFMTAARLLLF